MKTKNVLIISIISFVIVCISAGWFMYNKGPLNIHSSNGIEVSAEDLYATFEKDTSTAFKLYSDKVVLVSGVIEKIQNNNEQAQVILLHTNENGAYINCTMDETKPLKTGTRIIIKGICGGIGQGDEDLGLKGDVYITRAFIPE